MKIVVGHLYPDYLNIYADRGNIAVLARRAAWRGHELEVRPIGVGDAVGEPDLLYVGGGQDREQALVATGDRAAELALRFKYGGFADDAIAVVPSLEEALDRGLAETPAGGELVVLPTYTAMLALRAILTRRGLVRPYWERAA